MKAGFDIGGTQVHYVVIKGDRIINKGIFPTKSLNQVIEDIGRIIKKYNLKKLGIGVAGEVDCEKGILRFAPNLGWRNINFKKIFKGKFGVRVELDNDANCAALWAHHKFKKKYKNMILFTLGTGVGGGLIINNRKYHSVFGSAGELGHIIVEHNGRKCNCGSRGCLEAYVGAIYLRKKLRKRNWDLKDLTVNAEKGDRFSIKMYKEIGYWLGIACATLTNIFAPEVICFTGGVSGGYKFFIDEVKKVVGERSFETYSKKIKFKKINLSMYSGAIGAGYLIR